MSSGVIDLSVWQLGLALLLVAAVVAVSLRQALGLERDLAIGAVRTVVQLYGVGLILAAVFAAARWYWVVLILVAMTAVATHAAVKFTFIIMVQLVVSKFVKPARWRLPLQHLKHPKPLILGITHWLLPATP